MSLNSISVEFVAENAERIICSATVASADGNKATMLGQGKDIDSASQAAINNSKAQLAMLSGEKEPQSTYYPNQATKKSQYNNNPMDDKSKFNGGGSKSISVGQIEFIERLASEKKCSAEAMSQRLYQKPLMMLIGSEANFLINELKSRK